MLKKNELVGVMRTHGDRQIDLAKAIGISVQTLNAKINEKNGADFTKREIGVIKKRYRLSANEIDVIFFGGDDNIMENKFFEKKEYFKKMINEMLQDDWLRLRILNYLDGNDKDEIKDEFEAEEEEFLLNFVNTNLIDDLKNGEVISTIGNVIQISEDFDSRRKWQNPLHCLFLCTPGELNIYCYPIKSAKKVVTYMLALSIHSEINNDLIKAVDESFDLVERAIKGTEFVSMLQLIETTGKVNQNNLWSEFKRWINEEPCEILLISNVAKWILEKKINVKSEERYIIRFGEERYLI